MSTSHPVHPLYGCSDPPNSQTVFEYLYLGNEVCIWGERKKEKNESPGKFFCFSSFQKKKILRAWQPRRFVALANKLVVNEDAVLAGTHEIKFVSIVVQNQMFARYKAVLADVEVDVGF